MKIINRATNKERPYDFYLSDEYLDKTLPDSEYRSLLKTSDRELHLIFSLIETRFIDLEEKVFRSKQKNTATKSQKLLLMKHLGLLDIISNLNTTQEKKALLLSFIIDTSQENIRKDLQRIEYANDPAFYNKGNIKFLKDVFANAGLPNHSKTVENLQNRNKINRKKDK